MSLIYCLDFPNGKQYIGMTSGLLRQRLAIHRRDAKQGRQTALHRAWRKYGEPAHKVLAIVEPHMVRETEIKAIRAFGTLVPGGYNLMTGGEGGYTSAETRRKQSVASKGKPKSAAHCKNISEGQMGRPGTWTGKKQSPEHIAKRIAPHIGAKRSDETRKNMSEGRRRAREARLLSTQEN